MLRKRPLPFRYIAEKIFNYGPSNLPSAMEQIETVIVGGGQAGLAMSYYLGQFGREHVILERARVAERWRTQRWDSLMFQFPNWSIELPGCPYTGSDPKGFSHKDEVLKFVEDYCASIKAPLRTGVNVLSLRSAVHAGRYQVITDHGDLEAQNVVIATGPYQRARMPPISSALPPDINQCHASEYRNPDKLPAGAVLVVGSGASGCQIAEELLESGRQVYLSVGRHSRVPRRYRGRDVFWWRRALGHLDQSVDASPRAVRMPAPLVTGIRGGHDINLRDYAASGMTLLGHLLDMHDGRIAFAPDLEESLRTGDQAFYQFTRAVDEYISKRDMEEDSPQHDAMPVPPKIALQTIGEIDVRSADIGAVIWATGYALEFEWIKLPIFGVLGELVHRRGVSAMPGVYFLGLPWLHKSKSSFLYGVGEDAEFLARQIAS